MISQAFITPCHSVRLRLTPRVRQFDSVPGHTLFSPIFQSLAHAARSTKFHKSRLL
jgi:hypothetical protein